jgi:quinol monooxygenase YgiN
MSTIDPTLEVMTLINVFTVKPDACDELVQVLVDATEQTMRHLDGFVSANIHRSNDGQRVINYAQWTDLAAWKAMQSNPDAQPHIRRAGELAERFDPIICSVVDAIS